MISEDRNTPFETSTVLGTGDAVGVPTTAEQPPHCTPPAKYWFIARVSPNTEKSTRGKLTSLGFETFVASQPEVRFWKNGMRRKKKVVEKVVITQYLFLHLSPRERDLVLRYSFIKEFMRNRASRSQTDFAIMSEGAMRTLMALFGQSDQPVFFDTSDYSIGDEVVLHLGSFDYAAHVVRKHGDRGTYYGIRVGELGCAYMEVPPSALSPQHHPSR